MPKGVYERPSAVQRVLRRTRFLENGCVIYTGTVNWNGYGNVKTKGTIRGAHRIIYEAVHGSAPSTMHVDHLCKNRLCVLPAHLELVTPRENLKRSDNFMGVRLRAADQL